MNISSFLKNLILDTWYKALFYIGAIIMVLAFFNDVKGISNGQLQLLSAGIMFIGLGEWKNHKYMSGINPPNAYTGPAALIQAKMRIPDAFGIMLDVVGVILLLLGILSVVIEAIKQCPGNT